MHGARALTAHDGAQVHEVPGGRDRIAAPSIIGGVDDTRAEAAGSALSQEGAGAVARDSDAALMLAYAAGDAAAFNALYEKHERPVFRFLRRSLGGDGERYADELHQEVWLAVVRNAAHYEPRARFTTWLYGIARTKLIDHWRARRPATSLDEATAVDCDDGDADTLLDRLPAEPAAQPEVQVLTRAQGAAFLRAVEQLPAEQREVFLLHAEGELTLAEIGALTGVGMETAKSRLRYALSKLRCTLAAWR
jgi:RNA polymerase sigma-70 factor (ECF subfamily)